MAQSNENNWLSCLSVLSFRGDCPLFSNSGAKARAFLWTRNPLHGGGKYHRSVCDDNDWHDDWSEKNWKKFSATLLFVQTAKNNFSSTCTTKTFHISLLSPFLFPNTIQSSVEKQHFPWNCTLFCFTPFWERRVDRWQFHAGCLFYCPARNPSKIKFKFFGGKAQK